jgi:endoglucanase
MKRNMNPGVNRRVFLRTIAAAAASVAIPTVSHAREDPHHTQHVLPRWRGFNLHPFFGTWNNGIPVEDDYKKIADLGFNFVRLPMWYTHWTDAKDVYKVKEEVLERIDEAVAYARENGLHTCLNFHRAPGYCVAKDPPEPFDLFKDQEALDAFCFHWKLFADRYKNIPSKELSFNLVNEPIAPPEDHERVVRAAVKTIREASPDRLIICDGLMWGYRPAPELRDLNIAESTRGYEPHKLTHYKASWVEGADEYPLPTWPVTRDGKVVFTRENLEKVYAPMVEAARAGVGVHCGECGCFNKTPHPVVLSWLDEVLDILTRHNIGYALWEFRGSFGILDSKRSDVDYEDWHGHKLDRKLLDLLRKY